MYITKYTTEKGNVIFEKSKKYYKAIHGIDEKIGVIIYDENNKEKYSLQAIIAIEQYIGD